MVFEDKSQSETAREYGIKRQVVNKYINYIRKKLKKFYEMGWQNAKKLPIKWKDFKFLSINLKLHIENLIDKSNTTKYVESGGIKSIG